VGTGVCFLFLMVWLAYDLVMGRGPRLSAGAMVGTLIGGALWCLASSLVGGGIVGAFLGAIVGTIFPIRRGSR
jgi:hypothetical protein